jgi:hypothetical protein
MTGAIRRLRLLLVLRGRLSIVVSVNAAASTTSPSCAPFAVVTSRSSPRVVPGDAMVTTDVAMT